jgi:hypothetical protein
MMQLDFDDTVLLGLHGYVRSVCRALGLRGECSYVQGDAPVSAYIALDERLRRFPDHDVALVWDEHHGWSAAIETHSGDELPVVATLGRDLLPAPETVAAWARNLFVVADTTSPGERPVLAGGDTLRRRLSAYMGDGLSLPAGSRSHVPGSDEEPLAIA